jgi:hypothetical protein
MAVRPERLREAGPESADRLGVGGQDNFANVRANELPPQFLSIRVERACTQKVRAHLVESLKALKTRVEVPVELGGDEFHALCGDSAQAGRVDSHG